MFSKEAKMRKAIASVMVAMLAALVAPSANAAGPQKGPLAGVVALECTINLVSFPNPVKTNNPGNCNGLAAGLLSGLQQSAPGGEVVGVMAASPATVTAQYTEPCVQGALGFSNGVATVTSVIVLNERKDLSIVIDPNGVLTAPYSWTRVGVVAIITTGKLNALVDPKKGTQTTLTWNPNGVALDAIGGIGIGVLVPLGVPDEVNCPGAPLTVQVAAAILMI
jgi:hypothetical protein